MVNTIYKPSAVKTASGTGTYKPSVVNPVSPVYPGKKENTYLKVSTPTKQKTLSEQLADNKAALAQIPTFTNGSGDAGETDPYASERSALQDTIAQQEKLLEQQGRWNDLRNSISNNINSSKLFGSILKGTPRENTAVTDVDGRMDAIEAQQNAALNKYSQVVSDYNADLDERYANQQLTEQYTSVDENGNSFITAKVGQVVKYGDYYYTWDGQKWKKNNPDNDIVYK